MVIFVVLGITASIYQLVLLREFTFSVAKNELSLVVAIGVWIIFCSLGSLAGLKKKTLKISYLPFLYSLIFSFSVSSIHLIKNLAGLSYYEAASFGFIASSAFIFFGSLGFLIGYSFCLFCRIYLKKPHTSFTFAKFFGWEALGFFVGGSAFTFFLSSYSNPYFFALIPIIFYFFIPSGFRKKIIFSFFIFASSFLFVFSFGKIISSEFQGAEIKFYQGTPYGPIIETQRNDVTSFYMNGSLVGSSEDIIWDEKFVHISLSLVEKPEDILFIGPAFSHQLGEILKYNPENIDYLSLNKTAVNLAKERVSYKGKERINFIVSDPRKYLKSTSKKYDCIIVNKPAPSSLSLNRFFSLEFFSLAEKRLKEKGVFSFFIPSKRDILSPRFVRFDSCILNTVDRVFKNKILVPSDLMIVLASGQNITAQSILDNFSKRNIKTEYLTVFHLKDYLAKNRRDYVRENIDPAVGINRDFYPRGFLYYLLLQQAKFYPQFSIDIEQIKFYTILTFIFFGLFLVLASLRGKRVNCLISTFVVGFSSIAATAFIFVIFQSACGALFQMLGVLTGSFMLGLCAGSFLINAVLEKFRMKGSYLNFYFGLWVLYVLFLVLTRSFYLQSPWAMLILYFYSFFAGLLTGSAYPLISNQLAEDYQIRGNVPVFLYAADLTGAFLGTLSVSVFFIPFLGVWPGIGMVGCLLFLFFLRNFY